MGEMNAKQWLAAFAEQLGTEPPSTEEFKQLLDLAGRRRALERAGRRARRLLGDGAKPVCRRREALELAKGIAPATERRWLSGASTSSCSARPGSPAA